MLSVAPEYHFITRWRFQATPEELFSILSQPLEYPRWWPSVYRQVRQVGGRLRIVTSGWLPYRLRWDAVTTEVREPRRLAVSTSGDFEGRGIWSMVEDGPFTDVTFDWKVRPSRRLLRYLSPLLEPAFEANHRWAMEQGRQSLELELQRLRAATAAEMNAVPSPGGPHQIPRGEVALGTALAAVLATMFWVTRTR